MEADDNRHLSLETSVKVWKQLRIIVKDMVDNCGVEDEELETVEWFFQELKKQGVE